MGGVMGLDDVTGKDGYAGQDDALGLDDAPSLDDVPGPGDVTGLGDGQAWVMASDRGAACGIGGISIRCSGFWGLQPSICVR